MVPVNEDVLNQHVMGGVLRPTAGGGGLLASSG